MFYNGRLKDGENVKALSYNPSFLNGKQLKTVKNETFLDIPEKKMIKEEKIILEDINQDKGKGGGSFLSSLDSFLKMSTLKNPPAIDNIPPTPSHDPNMHLKNTTKVDETIVLLKPLLFFDLITSKDSSGGGQTSLVNIEESKLCMNILETLIIEARKAGTTLGSIGIITPYSEQLQEIRKRLIGLGLLTASGGSEALLDIEVNTVDGFQGKEKDIIIISCVRANDGGSIGFLSDTRRMNVALTRARFGLYIVGCAETLQSNPHWSKLIAYAESHDAMITVQDAYDPIMPLLAGASYKSASMTSSSASATSASSLSYAPPGKSKQKKKQINNNLSDKNLNNSLPIENPVKSNNLKRDLDTFLDSKEVVMNENNGINEDEYNSKTTLLDHKLIKDLQRVPLLRISEELEEGEVE
jgi:hypothetical protein